MSNASTVQRETLFGHPVGLFTLFFAEMWERFSYYGMRALLVLYMVNYFKWAQSDASTIYKWYTSLVYLTPLIGGYMAESGATTACSGLLVTADERQGSCVSDRRPHEVHS